MAVDDEIEGCVRTEYARLVQVVSIVTGSTPLAEEAVQEAFARAWERSQRGYEFEHLPGWIVTTALNQARGGRRRLATERRARARLASRPASDPGPTPELAIAVRAALDGLPLRQRDAIVLYYLLDLDVTTAARLLGVSTGTVKTALARGRDKLALLLNEHEVEADEQRHA